MKGKKEILYFDIKLKDLKKGDLVIVSHYQSGPYGDHCFSLGIVKTIKKDVLINMISSNYETKDIDNFIKNVDVFPFVCDVFNATTKHCYIFKASKKILSNAITKQNKSINSKIKKLISEVKDIEKFYEKLT
jgi:hypothetical protein